jgi:hypothetical protein
MGVKITRAMPLGAGSKGFRFRNYADTIEDQKQYEEGCTLEKARFRKGSIAEKIYERLSSNDMTADSKGMLRDK